MPCMLLFLLLLNACSSIPFTSTDLPLVDIPLSAEQQEVYLSKSKSAQHFGFQVFPRGEVGLREAHATPNQRAQVAMSQQIHSWCPLWVKIKRMTRWHYWMPLTYKLAKLPPRDLLQISWLS